MEEIKQDIQNYEEGGHQSIGRELAEDVRYDFTVYTIKEKIDAVKEIKNQISCILAGAAAQSGSTQQDGQHQVDGDSEATLDGDGCEPDFEKFTNELKEPTAEEMYNIESDFDAYIYKELSEPVD